jgi:hypothetical protein
VLIEYVGSLTKRREILGFLACLMYGRGITTNFDGAATTRLKGLCSHVRVNYGAVERKVRADAGKTGKHAKTKVAPATTAATSKKAKRAKAGTRSAAKAASKVKALRPRRPGKGHLPAAA